MARNTQTTTINLEMSASKALKTLGELHAKVARLSKELNEALGANDKGRAKNLQKELDKINLKIHNMQTEATNAAEVLKNLDQATPKQLRKTLRTLKSDLEKLTRGTQEYADKAKEIRRVQAELDKVNSELREQMTLWERIKSSSAGAVAVVQGAIASASGAIEMGRKSVEDYASMQQEMANVSKYSGLAAEDVERLNEEFKKMDTLLRYLPKINFFLAYFF